MFVIPIVYNARFQFLKCHFCDSKYHPDGPISTTKEFLKLGSLFVKVRSIQDRLSGFL